MNESPNVRARLLSYIYLKYNLKVPNDLLSCTKHITMATSSSSKQMRHKFLAACCRIHSYVGNRKFTIPNEYNPFSMRLGRILPGTGISGDKYHSNRRTHVACE